MIENTVHTLVSSMIRSVGGWGLPSGGFASLHQAIPLLLHLL